MRPLGGALICISGVLTDRKEEARLRHTQKKDLGRHREKLAIYKARRQTSEGETDLRTP